MKHAFFIAGSCNFLPAFSLFSFLFYTRLLVPVYAVKHPTFPEIA